VALVLGGSQMAAVAACLASKVHLHELQMAQGTLQAAGLGGWQQAQTQRWPSAGRRCPPRVPPTVQVGICRPKWAEPELQHTQNQHFVAQKRRWIPCGRTDQPARRCAAMRQCARESLPLVSAPSFRAPSFRASCEIFFAKKSQCEKITRFHLAELRRPAA